MEEGERRGSPPRFVGLKAAPECIAASSLDPFNFAALSALCLMLFTFFLVDKPGALAQRLEIRPEHKAYLGAKAEQIAFAGPLLADDGKTMVGSLLVIDFASREEAQHWIAGEPFTRAGVYASTSIYPFQNLWPQKAGFPPAS